MVGFHNHLAEVITIVRGRVANKRYRSQQASERMISLTGDSLCLLPKLSNHLDTRDPYEVKMCMTYFPYKKQRGTVGCTSDS